MLQALRHWYYQYLASEEAGYLIFVLAFFIILLTYFSDMLMPVFYGVAIAYLLDAVVVALERYCRIPHALSVLIVFVLFIAMMLLLMFAIFPLLIRQFSGFLRDLPDFSLRLQSAFVYLRSKAPFISDAELQNLVMTFKARLIGWGQSFVTLSLSSIPGLITFVVYFVMIPLLIYFFLMDKKILLSSCSRFLPNQRSALGKVWFELDKQIGNYIRGKVLEAIIIAIASYACFFLLGLEYAALLAVGVGFSIFIPYIGAVLITFPVFIVGLLQWGLTSHFIYLTIAYCVIMALDATVLMAVLFSGTNNLHPIVIIIATLVFGGIWGFWGVFFAIPLASLVKALIEHWPISKIT